MNSEVDSTTPRKARRDSDVEANVLDKQYLSKSGEDYEAGTTVDNLGQTDKEDYQAKATSSHHKQDAEEKELEEDEIGIRKDVNIEVPLIANGESHDDGGGDGRNKTLVSEGSVVVDIKSDDDEMVDTTTLPLNEKKNQDPLEFPNPPLPKKKPPMYLFPILRMKLAWASSSNMFEFIFKVIIIIFSTLGWFFCIGGIPFISIVMLIIGCIYIDDCRIQPNIPKYLIVSGVFGTIQHIIAIWTKYIPKDSQGRLRVYRAYCRIFDCSIQLFLTIWFILGCVWVYSAFDEVEFGDTEREIYCNKTLYLFAFWILNFSFIVLCLLAVMCLGCIMCIAITPKDEVNVQSN